MLACWLRDESPYRQVVGFLIDFGQPSLKRVPGNVQRTLGLIHPCKMGAKDLSDKNETGPPTSLWVSTWRRRQHMTTLQYLALLFTSWIYIKKITVTCYIRGNRQEPRSTCDFLMKKSAYLNWALTLVVLRVNISTSSQQESAEMNNFC